jgi:hypothetical protein
MGPIEDGVLNTLGAVDWAEIDAWEHSPQVQYKHIAEGSPQRKFSKTPDFLSPAHLTKQIPIKADRQQLTLTEAVCCAVQKGGMAPEIYLRAAEKFQRGEAHSGPKPIEATDRLTAIVER